MSLFPSELWLIVKNSKNLKKKKIKNRWNCAARRKKIMSDLFHMSNENVTQ